MTASERKARTRQICTHPEDAIQCTTLDKEDQKSYNLRATVPHLQVLVHHFTVLPMTVVVNDGFKRL